MHHIYVLSAYTLWIFVVFNVGNGQTVELTVCPTCTYVNINSAIAAAGSGDTINITAGSYVEPESIVGFILTLVTTGGEVTISTTSGYNAAWLVVDYGGVVTLDGQFTLAGAAINIRGTLYQYGRLTGIPSIRTLYIYNGKVYQYGIINVTCSLPATYAVLIFDGIWYQHGDVVLTLAPATSGVEFGNPLSPTWYQWGNVKISVAGAFGVNMYFSSLAYWFQYGNVDIVAEAEAIGVYIPHNAQWFQNGTISFTLSNSTGVYFVGAGNWLQEGNAMFNISSGTSSCGVEFSSASPGATWTQNASLTIAASGSGINCILFNMLDGLWIQKSPVSVSIHGNNSCGINFAQGNPTQWQQLGSESNFTVSGLTSHEICPVPLPNPLDLPIQFNFSATNPAVTLSQTGPHVINGSVEYMFLDLQELSPNDTIVQHMSLQNVTWSLDSQFTHNISNTTEETRNYTSVLSNGAVLRYTFLASSTRTTIALANNYTFATDPQYLKFSIWLSFWNWTDVTNRLRFTVRVSPVFNSSEQRINTPIADITTVFMRTSGSNATGALVELLGFGLAGSRSVPVICSTEVDASDSTFSMTFSYFGNLSLYYDPGLSLILGQSVSSSGDADSSGDNTYLVIALSVSIPVAFCVVLAVIFGAFAFIAINYIRARLRQGGMVNFTTGDLLRRNADRRDNVATL